MTQTHRTLAGAFAKVAAVGLLSAAAALGQGAGSIINSPHNLSASGPGGVRAASEEQVCIFCHTPHNASAVQPLWNRQQPMSAYTPYRSNSLQALPGQPTGSSKLCLSCHDGTIALGSVFSRNQPIAMAGGMTTLPPGKSNLGTDLSDDHPISFPYDTALVGKNPQLRQPGALPPSVHLDANSELQCTSCHDAHSNAIGKFLVMDNSNSQLCRSCHLQDETTVLSHQQCASCHQPHTAPSGPYLLRGRNVSRTCTSCHSSQPSPNQGADIASLLAKASVHDTDTRVDETPHVPNNVTCADCHESHTMGSGTASAPLISPRLGRIGGVNASGASVARAQYEYEVCYKCHGDNPANNVTLMSRKVVQANKRLQFAPTALSYHPVQIAGKSSNVPSLIAPLTTSSVIYCSDCHNSDVSSRAGGSGASGPHGSAEKPLLIARYSQVDQVPETADAYALCYRCHNRSSLLLGQSFPQHQGHINQTPCSTCHDAHGIPQSQGSPTGNVRLINFNLSIVQPDPVSKRLEYVSEGEGAGSCYLSCHDRAHSPLSYPAVPAPEAAGALRRAR